MSAAVDDGSGALLRRTDLLLLDFDGPICSVFAGRSAHDVADALRASLVDEPVSLSSVAQTSSDPLTVLRSVGRNAPPALVDRCDNYLVQLEVEAVATAAPTAAGHDVIRASAAAHLPVVIVSNNSKEAITAYLKMHNLEPDVAAVCGRPRGRPQLMKPSPWLLRRALNRRSASTPVFIGDSASDSEAADAAGVPVVALANKPGKAARFSDLGAQHIVEDMATVARWLATSPAAM